MKNPSFIISCLFFSLYCASQVPITSIEGYLDLAVPDIDHSVYIGSEAGQNSRVDTILSNVFIGYQSGRENIRGSTNNFVGAFSGAANTFGDGNTYFGNFTGDGRLLGFFNTCIGNGAGRLFSTEVREFFGNTMIGSEAGRSAQGSGNVFLGMRAGFGSMGDNRLMIANASGDSTEVLIYGEFDNEVLRINGDLHIASNNPDGNSRLRMKGAGGVLNEVIRYDSDNNNILVGSVSGAGGKLFFRSDSRSQMALLENGNLGVGVLDPQQKLHVDGTIRLDDVPSSSGSFDLRMNSAGDITRQTSDARLKKNIATLDRSLEKLLSLRGVSFTWNEDPKAGVQLGLVAQEVIEVIPEIVHQNFDGFYSVDYSELVGVFVEAIKEQQDLITSLKAQNTSLEERVLLLEKQFQALTH